MLKTILVLPDGTELSSGVDARFPILSCTITESVNENQELTLGSACISKLEAKIRTPDGELRIAAGQEIAAYKTDLDGLRHPMGLFVLEKPVRSSANTMTMTAYDRISRLDRDLSDWVRGLNQWPMKLYDFAKEVCEACGLQLFNADIPNGEYPVQAFTGAGITGRQLIRWAAQAAGRFVRATADGQVEFAWYEPMDRGITPDGDSFYYQNSLSYSDYQIYPIEKVQIQLTDEDMGSVYPEETGEKNTYRITGNALLTAEKSEDLQPVARVLYEQLRNVTYTPCKVEMPIDISLCPGSIVTVTDRNGRQLQMYVMRRTISGQRMTLECTGSHRLDSTGVVNDMSIKTLSGRVLELRMGVEGLSLQNRDTTGKLAQLQLDVSGLASTIIEQGQTLGKTEEVLTEIRQSTNEVKLSVERIRTEGAPKVKTGKGYTFDDSGMHITDYQSDITNNLDHTGMYVRRGEEPLLQANKDGVVATDVTVNNYLVIGHGRFEAYADSVDSKRTACFFV